MRLTDLQVPLFDGLDQAEREAVAELATMHTYADGETIVREGDSGRGLYLLACGRVAIAKRTIDGDFETIATLSAGECFGEMSLVDPKPRSATVLAQGTATVYGFEQGALDSLLAARGHLHLTLLKNLVRVTSDRLRFGNDSLVQSAYDTVIEVDFNNRIRRLVQLTERHTIFDALPATKLVEGQRLADVVPRLGEGVCAQIDRVCAGGVRVTLDLEYEHGSSTLGFYQMTIAPGTDQRGPIRATIGIRDVTESKALEARLMQAEKMALAGQRSAEIGHELRNYLTVLVSHVELLRYAPQVALHPTSSKSLDTMQEQLRRMEQFATGLMDSSSMRLRPESSDINALVENLIDFVRGQQRFRQVAFETLFADDLPRVSVDPGQIHQVLMNLYANAADAMGSGNICCRTGIADGGAELFVAVEDTGPGIPESQLENIFQSGVTTKETGHGFGLAVCRRIMQSHSGRIDVSSAPGKGSVFRLSFPLVTEYRAVMPNQPAAHVANRV